MSTQSQLDAALVLVNDLTGTIKSRLASLSALEARVAVLEASYVQLLNTVQSVLSAQDSRITRSEESIGAQLSAELVKGVAEVQAALP